MTVKRILTGDGSHSLLSEEFGVPYHSVHGAVQETRHVFIQAGFLESANNAKHLKVLELGFGTGLNALMTFLEASLKGVRVSYTGLDTSPVSPLLASTLNYPELVDDDRSASILSAMHLSPWEEATPITQDFILTKHQTDACEWVSSGEYHVVYYDAFAPAAQPHLWEPDVLRRFYESLLPGGILTTYCAKGQFKRNLKSVGFEVEPLPGPPGKREMTRARKPKA